MTIPYGQWPWWQKVLQNYHPSQDFPFLQYTFFLVLFKYFSVITIHITTHITYAQIRVCMLTERELQRNSHSQHNFPLTYINLYFYPLPSFRVTQSQYSLSSVQLQIYESNFYAPKTSSIFQDKYPQLLYILLVYLISRFFTIQVTLT